MLEACNNAAHRAYTSVGSFTYLPHGHSGHPLLLRSFLKSLRESGSSEKSLYP